MHPLSSERTWTPLVLPTSEKQPSTFPTNR